MTKPFVLSVAGLDPSGGAGLLADAGTIAAFDLHGLAACTALTLQNDVAFRGVEWVDRRTVLAQIETLLARYPLAAMKIGLIESVELLLEVTELARERQPSLPIVWDPVFAPSAVGRFRDPWTADELRRACERLTVLTPNRVEMMAAFPERKPEVAAAELSNAGAVFLKGGHVPGDSVIDQLFVRGVCEETFTGPRLAGDKRGTGCVTSSAIAAGLALGETPGAACRNAIRYVRGYIGGGGGPFSFHQQREAVHGEVT